MVGLVGIEPTTYALGVRRSIQLSYSPTGGILTRRMLFLNRQAFCLCGGNGRQTFSVGCHATDGALKRAATKPTATAARSRSAGPAATTPRPYTTTRLPGDFARDGIA